MIKQTKGLKWRVHYDPNFQGKCITCKREINSRSYVVSVRISDKEERAHIITGTHRERIASEIKLMTNEILSQISKMQKRGNHG